MDASFFIVGKFLLSSALLLALYWLVLRNRASYKLSRLYLLTLPMLSAMMSGLTFEVTLPAGLISEEPVVAQREAMTSQVDASQQAPRYLDLDQILPMQNRETATVAMDKAPAQSIHRSIDYSQWLMLIVPAVSAILLLLAIFYVSKLLWLKSRLKAEKTPEGYDLIRSAGIATPFSFGRSIFLPADLDAASERMILSHEKAHIEHHHYLEVWLMEFMTRLLWFNPVVWLCRSELSNVHEFEADRDVISQGANILAYQTTLLEMIMSEGCPVVNGFNKSFIRQRFIEMKKTTVNTLGRMGKFGTAAWVIALICLFTISCKPEKTNVVIIPELDEPQLFVIEGVVDENITDSCYNIYLGDEYFHIVGETPDTCVQVTDKRFHYEVPLTKVMAGRVRCIFPGDELCSAWIDLWFVPGQTVQLNVHNGYYDLEYLGENGQYNYESKVERTVYAVRGSTGLKTPHFTEPKAKKMWETVECKDTHRRVDVRKVLFNDDETILQLTTDEWLYSTNFGTELVLTDSVGNKYKYIRSLTEGGDGNWNKETLVFGAWYAFEALPKDIDMFNLHQQTENYSQPICENIRKGEVPEDQSPNFTLRIIASEGIGDCGYLVRLYDKGEHVHQYTQVADLPLDENRSCTFTYHLDEQRIGETIAIFPGGTICTHCERFPFVPGEEAELRVYNGYYHLTGKTPFYKAWGAADEYCENIRKYRSSDEAHTLMDQYLKDHGSEEGCLRYFDMQMGWSKEALYEAMSEELRNSELGFRVQTEVAWEKARAEKEALHANDPLYVVRFEQDGKTQEGMIDEESVESIIASPGFVEKIEYKGDDPERPLSYVPRSRNGVILIVWKQ